MWQKWQLLKLQFVACYIFQPELALNCICLPVHIWGKRFDISPVHSGVHSNNWFIENIDNYQLCVYQAVTDRESILLKNCSCMVYTLYLRSCTPWKSIIYTKNWVQPENSGNGSSYKDSVICTFPMPLVVSHYIYQLFSGISASFCQKHPVTYLFLSKIGQKMLICKSYFGEKSAF